MRPRFNTIERAQHRWREILPQLGVDTRFITKKAGPCPICGGRDRFCFDDKNGVGTYFCRRCGAGTGVMLLCKLHGWDHKTACDKIDEIIGQDGNQTAPQTRAADPANEKARRLYRIRRTLSEACDERVVAAFLKSRRLAVTSSALRGHPACPYFEDGTLVGRFPAVVAPILADDGSLESAALIYSAAAPEPHKKFLPKVNTINGAAVRLYEPENGHLGLAEGIATAMAARQLFGVPTWAALSATGVKTWQPPPDITWITVYADNDEHHVGQLAAHDLAHRLHAAGLKTDVVTPNVVGADFADLLPDLQEH
jgi:putative DNA primase/helicase